MIGAALDLGSGRRGVDMGPSAIRYAQLGERVAALGHVVHDHGNVSTGMVEALDEGDPTARYWSAIRRTCEELADRVAGSVADGEMPLVLGGDHSIAIGTLGGLARATATATWIACGSALPMSSEANTIIRRAMNLGSSPPEIITAR